MVLKFDFLEFLKTYIPAINYDYLLFELNVCPSDIPILQCHLTPQATPLQYKMDKLLRPFDK